MKKSIATLALGLFTFVFGLVRFIVGYSISGGDWGFQSKGAKNYLVIMVAGAIIVGLGVYLLFCYLDKKKENKSISFLVLSVILTMVGIYTLGAGIKINVEGGNFNDSFIYYLISGCSLISLSYPTFYLIEHKEDFSSVINIEK